MIKLFVVRLLERYTITELQGIGPSGVASGSKDSWVPLSKMQIHLQPLSVGA